MTSVHGTCCYNVYSLEKLETLYTSINGSLLNELYYVPTIEYYVVVKKNEKTLYTGMA